jgi:hypothetical protein
VDDQLLGVELVEGGLGLRVEIVQTFGEGLFVVQRECSASTVNQYSSGTKV